MNIVKLALLRFSQDCFIRFFKGCALRLHPFPV
jgi:hypothetical protein